MVMDIDGGDRRGVTSKNLDALLVRIGITATWSQCRDLNPSPLNTNQVFYLLNYTGMCFKPFLLFYLEPRAGIEPTKPDYKSGVLPL